MLVLSKVTVSLQGIINLPFVFGREAELLCFCSLLVHVLTYSRQTKIERLEKNEHVIHCLSPVANLMSLTPEMAVELVP